MAEFIYTLAKARKAHGDKVILDDVTLSFLPGAKIGVVGPNGAGKSSLLKIMAGVDKVSNGDAFLSPGFTVGMLAQEPDLDDSKTVLENVELGVADTKAMLDRFNEISAQMGDADADFDALMAEMGTLQEQIDHRNAWDLDSQLEQAMDALRCPPSEADVSVLSGGERNRLNLALTLKQGGNVLLLDEPTNDLDVETLGSLENALLEFPGCAVITSHDRWFLDRIATHILAYEGDSQWFWFEGNFESYEKNKIERLGAEAARPHRATYRKLTR